MKWSTFKLLTALICINSQLLTGFQVNFKEEPKNLSPISPLVTTPVMGKMSLAGLLPQKERALPLVSLETLVEATQFAPAKIETESFKGSHFNITPKGDRYEIHFEGKTQTAKRFGSFFVFDQIHLSETGKFVLEAFDLETEKKVALKNIGKFLVLNQPFTFESGELFRAWDFQTQQEVALLHPHHSETKNKSSFLILKDPIGRDDFGNKIFRAVDRKTGDELELIETGDFLIEKVSTREGTFYVKAWDKREMIEKEITKFVVSHNGIYKEYFVFQVLGQGGMGKVEKAWDPAAKKFVAIKQLLENASENRDMISRFNREAEIMQQMNHPNIINVTEKGDNPAHFYVMDYVDGKPLDEVLNHHSLSISQAVEIISQVAEGLSYVHDFKSNDQPLDIVHRDIKPQNLFLTHTGDVLILDFGISHVSGATQLTRTGLIMGTPHFMSPEQVNPLSSDEIDRTTDIYALGILLYQLVVGESPFKAKSVTKLLAIKSVDEAHEKFLHEGMLQKQINQHPEVLEKLEEIILKAAAFDPEERYQNAQEMLEELKTLRESSFTFPSKKQTVKELTATLVVAKTVQQSDEVSQNSFQDQKTEPHIHRVLSPLESTILEAPIHYLNLDPSFSTLESAL